MIKILLLILIAVTIGAGGQVLFKKSVNNIETPSLKCLKSYSNFLKNVLKSRLIWFGFLFIGISVIFWLMALAQTELSIAYPLESIHYILTLIFASIFLNEKIDKMKIIGTTLVVLGIILIAIS